MKEPFSDAEIIRGLKRRDKEVVDYIVSRYYYPACGFILKRGGKKENAEDIFQDALIALIEHTDDSSFSITHSFSSYLFGIINKLWLYHCRKYSMEQTVRTDFRDTRATESSTFDEIEKRELYLYHFERLSGLCKLILSCYYEKMAVREIAQRLEMSEANVRKTKERCKIKLIRYVREDPRYLELKK